MSKYKYNDLVKQAAYENSCDCLRYGYGFDTLNKCGLSEEEAKKIWNEAIKDMSKF